MADYKQGAGWRSGSSAAVHKAHCSTLCHPMFYTPILNGGWPIAIKMSEEDEESDTYWNGVW